MCTDADANGGWGNYYGNNYGYYGGYDSGYSGGATLTAQDSYTARAVSSQFSMTHLNKCMTISHMFQLRIRRSRAVEYHGAAAVSKRGATLP